MSNGIYVWIDLKNTSHLVGKLWSYNKKGKESTSFEYDESWLNNPHRLSLEPNMKLSKGIYHTKNNQSIFGSIGDSAPDRWGRVLMKRAEILQARKEKRNIRTLFEIDYLIGVNDYTRQGALRFTKDLDTNYLTKSEVPVPPIVNLAKLLNASTKFMEKKDTYDDMQLLLAPGSSLGGARPKASVIDSKNNLYIAKFPSKNDEYDVVKWEAFALELAKQAGLDTPEFRLEKINNNSVLLVKRFDRNITERIPFLSAMSMLEANDNEEHSYLEIAYAIIQNSNNPNKNLKELWKRIIFTILINNTDDHLRNHGFVYNQEDGWVLSRVYDINPTPLSIKKRFLSTNIDFNNNEASIELALSIIKEFKISLADAKSIIAEVQSITGNWLNIAKQYNIFKSEIDMLASIFEN